MWGRRPVSYRAVKKVSHAGFSFASKLEAALYDYLKLDPNIKFIKCQSTIYLTDARIVYRVDFECTDINGTMFWAEAKGFETDVWRIKRKLWQYYGPGRLDVYKGSHTKLRFHESITPVVAQ